jgi:hypothetical protein
MADLKREEEACGAFSVTASNMSEIDLNVTAERRGKNAARNYIGSEQSRKAS